MKQHTFWSNFLSPYASLNLQANIFFYQLWYILVNPILSEALPAINLNYSTRKQLWTVWNYTKHKTFFSYFSVSCLSHRRTEVRFQNWYKPDLPNLVSAINHDATLFENRFVTSVNRTLEIKRCCSSSTWMDNRLSKIYGLTGNIPYGINLLQHSWIQQMLKKIIFIEVSENFSITRYSSRMAATQISWKCVEAEL